jgi:hypothetical protein
MKRWLSISVLLVALVLASLALMRPTSAQSAGCSTISQLSVSLLSSSTSMTANFDAGDAISVSAYYVDNPAVGYPLVLDVSGASQTGNPVSYTIPASGSYTVTVTSNFDARQQLTASCTPAPPPASSTPTATSTSTAVPPSATHTATSVPTNTPRPTATPWPGTTDGRLGGEPAEAYSLWCSGNSLNVWSAASGRGVQLAAIPLASLIGQPVGVNLPYLAAGGPVFVVRNGPDSFAVQGNTGNNAPAFGIKPFSLAQCITANGGAPVVPPTRTPTRPASSTPPPSKTPTATATRAPTATLDPSVDSDGDGVRNSLDVCKDVPGTVYGCPDPDGDGAAGPLDLCPDAAGPLSLRGCPDADTDGDGVPDSQDLCPRQAATLGNTQGCDDRDNDGVPDSVTIDGTVFVIDWCAVQTPQNVPQVQGCNDPDNDGMVNGGFVPVERRDSCPQVAGLPELQGCPPAENIIIPTFNPTQALFAYASQTGAYAGLTVNGYVPQSGNCNLSSFGFCFNIVSPTATPTPRR